MQRHVNVVTLDPSAFDKHCVHMHESRDEIGRRLTHRDHLATLKDITSPVYFDAMQSEFRAAA